MYFFRQFIGPVLTLVIVLITYLLSAYVSVSFGLAHTVLVWTAYISSPLSTLASLVILATFIIVTYSPDWPRMLQALFSVIATAVILILLKRKAAMSESLNGNVNRLREALGITRELLNVWGDFSDQGKFKRVRDIEDKLGNLAALVYGWHKIRQEIEETKAELGSNGIKQSTTDINTINKP